MLAGEVSQALPGYERAQLDCHIQVLKEPEPEAGCMGIYMAYGLSGSTMTMSIGWVQQTKNAGSFGPFCLGYLMFALADVVGQNLWLSRSAVSTKPSDLLKIII